ncbi:MAG: hypothetical protein CL908_02445 [Deltaproteobacteria bacterium]|jgi:hypothetical protein|nr:hypothetical protein [Deltaproteobacteria bacterium]
MAAKKKTGSGAPKKKSAKRKSPVKKKAAPKKGAASTEKKASAKAAAPAKKKAEARKDPAAKPDAAPTPARPEGSVSSMGVTLGHVFALRPRVNTSFRQNDLSQAKRALASEVYPDLAEAARAVAAEALALTRGAAARPERRRRR